MYLYVKSVIMKIVSRNEGKLLPENETTTTTNPERLQIS